MRAPLSVARRRLDTPFAVVGSLLFVVGAAGAVAQAALGSALEVALGSTAAAFVGVVLALLVGTGAGAAFTGAAMVRRARPLLVAGASLVAVAALELALARLWPAMARAPVALRALVGGPLLLVPSIATGMLLPVLARACVRDPRGSRRMSAPFWLALAGSAFGAALAAGVLLPSRGGAAVGIAAAASAMAGALAAFASWRWPVIHDAGPPAHPTPRSGPNPLALGAVAHGFLSGAALLVLGHLARVVTQGADGTLAAFLAGTFAGLGAGAAQARTMQLRYRDTAIVRALGASGLLLAATLPLWGLVPSAFAVGGTFLRSAPDAAVLHIVAALVTTALPAAWIGASFQLLLPHFAGGAIVRGAAQSAGAGAAGATLGASLASVLLVPWLGSQRALGVIALGFAALAIGLAWRGRARRSAVLTAIATAILVVVFPRWDAGRFAFRARLPATSQATENVASGFAATISGTVGVNGSVVELGIEERRTALLASLFAPRLEHAAATDDVAIGSALLGSPWARVTSSRLPSSLEALLPTSLRPAWQDPRSVRIEAHGLDALVRSPRTFQATIVHLTPACGGACAREVLGSARGALVDGGVAVVVARSPEPASLAALARAAFASSKYAALAAFGARAVVLSSGAPLAVPPGRLEALKDADAAATLDTVVAKGAALDACATTLLARREASLTTLRACGGGAAGAPAPVSR